ncbi:hypothetical protein ES703_77297 [subsurface metagenome]
MKRTFQYGVNNRVSPATIELLLRERNKGKTLRQLGQRFGKSHERIRQLLAKHDRSQGTLLAESTVAAKLGYPLEWLIKLRKDGIVNPMRQGGLWLYSEEQVSQIPSLIAEERKCQQCGKPRPPGFHKFCPECCQYRKKHYYERLSPEEKAEHNKKAIAWRKANPERWNEIQSREYRKRRASHRGNSQ